MITTPTSLSAAVGAVTVTVARREGETLEAMERRLRVEVAKATTSEPAKATTFIDR